MQKDIYNVDAKLEDIFRSVLGLNFGNMEEEAKSLNLLGSKLGMHSRDLLYIFFEIEKSFDISIPQEVILEEKFNSFINISDIVKHQFYGERIKAI